MSGYTDSFIAGHGVLEAGAHLMHKPFTEETLTRKVREMLDANRGECKPEMVASVPALASEDNSRKP